MPTTVSAAQRQRRRRGRGRDVERMLDAQRRRTARARLPDERRAAVCEMNARTREARARMTDERRAAVREVHTSRMRESRAQRQLVASSRRMWCELPVHRTPNPPVLQLSHTKMCPYCRAVLLMDEDTTFCCRSGKIDVDELPALPPRWLEMFHDVNFRKASRKYNNLFCFTALGITGDERFVHQAAPSCVKINGRTYHRVLPGDMRGTVRWGHRG